VVGMSIYGPGMEGPFNKHEGSETVIIVHGKGLFGTREKTVEAGPGDVLYIPPGEEHFLKNIGNQTLEFIFVYSKPGDEKPIKETWIPIKK